MERAPPDGLLNASGALAGEAAAAGGARGFSAAWTAVLAALMALLIVATVLGNALVMLAFVADSSLRTQNNFFLLNLAISDFLVGKAPRPRPLPESRAQSPGWAMGLGAPTWGGFLGSGPGEGTSRNLRMVGTCEVPRLPGLRTGAVGMSPGMLPQSAGAQQGARRSNRGYSAGSCAEPNKGSGAGLRML